MFLDVPRRSDRHFPIEEIKKLFILSLYKWNNTTWGEHLFRLLLPPRGRLGPCRRVPVPRREFQLFFSSSSLSDRQLRSGIGHSVLQAARSGPGPFPVRRAGPPGGRLSKSGDHLVDARARGQSLAPSRRSLLFEDRPHSHLKIRAAPLRPPLRFADLDGDPAGARGRIVVDVAAVLVEESSLVVEVCLRRLGPDALHLRVCARLSAPLGRRRGHPGRLRDAQRRRRRKWRQRRRRSNRRLRPMPAGDGIREADGHQPPGSRMRSFGH